MKPITLPVAELKPALTGLGKVLNGRTTLAILSNIKVERTHDGWIALTSTGPRPSMRVRHCVGFALSESVFVRDEIAAGRLVSPVDLRLRIGNKYYGG